MTLESQTANSIVDPLGSSFLADPYPHLAQQREAAPVSYCEDLDMWLVTRWEDVQTVFRDHETYSAGNVQAPLLPLCEAATNTLKGRFNILPVMSNLDQPGHTRIRRKLARAFSARRMRVLTPVIERRCSEMLDSFAGKREVDLATDLCYPLPAVTIFSMVGFPEEDTDQIKAWCADKLIVNWGRPTEEHQIRAAETMVAFWEYCVEFAQKRRNNPADDMTSDLMADDKDGAPLTDQEIASILFGLSFAGHETTTNQAANCIRQVIENDLWQTLRDDRSLVPGVVEEGLRHDSSVVAWRRMTTRETELGGVALPEGAKLMISLGAANRDPDKFENPDTFDPCRENASNHLSFGIGIHLCLGRPLAKIELETMLNLLLDRYKGIRFQSGTPLEFPANISFRGPMRLPVVLDPQSG
ncbi:MAG: cytochrome P450 [Pseudomonadota bacterium]